MNAIRLIKTKWKGKFKYVGFAAGEKYLNIKG